MNHYTVVTLSENDKSDIEDQLSVLRQAYLVNLYTWPKRRLKSWLNRIKLLKEIIEKGSYVHVEDPELTCCGQG